MTDTSHIVFDLDGTLLDTEALYTEASQYVVGQYGKAFSIELKRQTMGGDTRQGAELVVRTLSLPIEPDAFTSAREAELVRLLPQMQPMPGAIALIEGLTSLGIPMALATSGHREITERKLALFPFLQSFPVVICGDDPRLRHPKPAPDIFLLAARDLGADPRSCMAFEDSANGVLAATRAGMRTIAIVNPVYGFDPHLFSSAERVVSSLEEIVVEDLLRTSSQA
jgi:pseudouridine-5'-monophosphatase